MTELYQLKKKQEPTNEYGASSPSSMPPFMKRFAVTQRQSLSHQEKDQRRRRRRCSRREYKSSQWQCEDDDAEESHDWRNPRSNEQNQQNSYPNAISDNEECKKPNIQPIQTVYNTLHCANKPYRIQCVATETESVQRYVRSICNKLSNKNVYVLSKKLMEISVMSLPMLHELLRALVENSLRLPRLHLPLARLCKTVHSNGFVWFQKHLVKYTQNSDGWYYTILRRATNSTSRNQQLWVGPYNTVDDAQQGAEKEFLVFYEKVIVYACEKRLLRYRQKKKPNNKDDDEPIISMMMFLGHLYIEGMLNMMIMSTCIETLLPNVDSTKEINIDMDIDKKETEALLYFLHIIQWKYERERTRDQGHKPGNTITKRHETKPIISIKFALQKLESITYIFSLRLQTMFRSMMNTC